MDTTNIDSNNKRVTTAVLLAAGIGSRLRPITQDVPKCLTEVNGVSILEQLVVCLVQQGFKRLVVVTGHFEFAIHDFLGSQVGGMEIEYVHSPLYATTNNIYSLWLASDIIREPFLLFESDLIFDMSLLDDMLHPDRIAVAGMKPWMNGTTVTVNRSHEVEAFWTDTTGPSDEVMYKTVNIYSFSYSTWCRIRERLDQHISAGNVNDYYEKVFAEMIADGSLSLKTVSFDSKPWYEIDTLEDLAKAEEIFSMNRHRAATPATKVKVASRSFQKLREREIISLPKAHSVRKLASNPASSSSVATPPGRRLSTKGSRSMDESSEE